MTARRWRLLVHALDRTGPPMLLATFLRWVRANEPAVELEVIAFRGGPLEREVAGLADLTIVLEPNEPWDVRAPDPDRVRALRARLRDRPPASANLLVSTSASQVLPLLPPGIGPVLTWSVEIGEDLHWLGDPVGLAASTDRWLAGSVTTRAELLELLGEEALVEVIPEFVDAAAPDGADTWRAQLGGSQHRALLVGAGIGTFRKGIDLFVEVAAACRRRGLPVDLAWIGGEHDALHPMVRAQAEQLHLGHVRFVPSTPDIAGALAAADVFVHVARVDAFPLVALHAVLAGTPVVAFGGTGGIEEMLQPAFRGAPYPDLEALVDAIEATLEPAARADLVARQRRRVRARYTADVAAPRLRDALVDVEGTAS